MADDLETPIGIPDVPFNIKFGDAAKACGFAALVIAVVAIVGMSTIYNDVMHPEGAHSHDDDQAEHQDH